MSQSTKRNAEDASIESQPGRQAKRLRRKNRKSHPSNEIIPSSQSTATNDQQDIAESSTPLIVASQVINEERLAKKHAGSHLKAKPSTPKKDGAAIQDIPSTLSKSKSTLHEPSRGIPKEGIKRPHEAELPNDLQLAKPTPRDLAPQDHAHDKKTMIKSKSKKMSRRGTERHGTWKISDRIGGIFLDIDPILSSDNQHLLLLTKHDVQIYSTKTSLLMRSVPGEENSEFRTCTLSTSNPHHIYVATRNGLLTKFDWTIGRRLSYWKTKPGILSLSFAGTYQDHEVFYAVRSQRNSTASLIRLSVASKGSQISVQVLLESDFLHGSIQFSQDLSIIVVCSKDRINVGYAPKSSSSENVQYSWETLSCRGRIVSFDTRISEAQSRKTSLSHVDVAVGLHNGAIITYTDILTRLFGQKNAESQVHEIGRRLHWHRTAVKSVKWSRDGNYLISGGNETVLVIWQLDTNQKQFLPHLSTSILNITISQSGAHYALRLGDNSVMVLSTADLVPSSNITGFLTSGDGAGAVLLHPSSPNKLLSAVSARMLGSGATGEVTHLQVYDISAKMQLSRQALTRNLTTAVNVDPTGQAIHEPNVTQLCTSTDGDWLATIDEWVPNATDLSSLYLEGESVSSLQETTLRFWAWRPNENSWKPNTRVENPHSLGASVFAMASNPIKSEVTTLGLDGCLKIWTPKMRVRNGLSVKDEEGQILHTWSCSRTVHIVSPSEASELAPEGAVTYSEDGSVIAACWATESRDGPIHLIDPVSGAVVLSQLGLVGRGLVRLQFCGRYLLALSDMLTMFDTILLQTVSCITLDTKFTSSEHSSVRQLAVNALTKTVAVGVTFQEQQNRQSHISIFDLQDSGPVLKFESTLSGHIRALLVDSQREGFIVVDAEATIRRLTPSVPVSLESLALIRAPNVETQAVQVHKGVDDILGQPQKNHTAAADPRLLLNGETEDGISSLDALFGASDGRTTPRNVHDLFEQVVKAVSGVHVGA